jgi:hypothetical protein
LEHLWHIFCKTCHEGRLSGGCTSQEMESIWRHVNRHSASGGLKWSWLHRYRLKLLGSGLG